MRFLTFLPVAGLVLGTLACSGPSVRYDFEAKADFAQFHTYAWQAAPRPGPGRAGAFDNAIMDGRVKRTVEAELAAKGYQRDDAGHPDFLVDCYPLRQSSRSSQTHLGFGLGMGPVGVGVAAPVGDRKVEAIGSLVLEIQDARTRILVWKGTAESALNSTDSPEEADSAVQAAVRNLLKRFPPTGR